MTPNAYIYYIYAWLKPRCIWLPLLYGKGPLDDSVSVACGLCLSRARSRVGGDRCGVSHRTPRRAAVWGAVVE